MISGESVPTGQNDDQPVTFRTHQFKGFQLDSAKVRQRNFK